MIKQDIHSFRGMQRDLTLSKFNPEYYYDARNMRLTSDGELTSLSVERGTTLWLLTSESTGKEMKIPGTILGSCSLNNYIVLFVRNTDSTSSIYRLLYRGEGFIVKELFRGNLNFKDPIETLGVYENEYIQKVYWVDGINQPRVINIVDNKSKYDDYSFDFVPVIRTNYSISIDRKSIGNGMFAPGTIHYAFTYYYKYRQETAIFYTSGLEYISFPNRGGSPEDKVSNSFVITMKGLDTKFDYVRIYSIHRTSIDAVPTVTRVVDLELNSSNITYIDNGSSGETIDPSQLLYIGGKSFSAYTMASKDNTLFLGNINLSNIDSLAKAYESNIISAANSSMTTGYRSIVCNEIDSDKYYSNANQLSSGNTSYFKPGEHYKFGIQFQTSRGEWTSPIPLKTYTIPDSSRPELNGSILRIPKVSVTLSSSLVNTLKSGYIKARGVVVYPSLQDRKIVAQGILCPTVFNSIHRKSNTPFAQSSWFVRPNLPYNVPESMPVHGGSAEVDNNKYIDNGAWVEFRHLHSLINANDRGGEIQSATYSPSFNTLNTALKSEDAYSTVFMVDQSVVTMHSPDIEFDDRMATMENSNLNLRIVGIANFTSSIGDIDIQTSTPVIPPQQQRTAGSGFIHKNLGSAGSSKLAGRSLVAGLFYRDYIVDEDKNNNYYAWKNQDTEASFMIYPWHRSGSLNNDATRPDGAGTQSSKLLKKKISNLKFSANNTWLATSNYWKAYDSSNKTKAGISKVQLFNSNEMSLVKIPRTDGLSSQLNYYGNVDSLITSEKEFDIMASVDKPASFYSTNIKNIPTIQYDIGDFDRRLKWPKDPIRMKYKSSPHFVFGLNFSTLTNTQQILPSCGNLNRVSITSVPYWSTELGSYSTQQDNIPILPSYPWLYIAELYRSDSDISNAFREIEELQWIPAGEPVVLIGNTTIDFIYGDTWYQRYDCLKTYPYTQEDENQIVEIASFMCESRVNIDGRYDRNRGQVSNLNMSNTNFNLINKVYSQSNNFFSYRILDEDYYKLDKFSNAITWSKEKSMAEKVDTWTSISMASTLDLDGDKGPISSLNTFNNEIYCFQKNGFSNILFNSRVQIPASDGVPIEISNGLKVTGKRYISNTIGCSNKWSIAETPLGIYFIDNTINSIYLFNGQLSSLSDNLGFKSWLRENREKNPSKYGVNNIWTPVLYDNYRTFYDITLGDVYFTCYNTSLVYSERLGQFMSFMDYGGIPLMFNKGDQFFSMDSWGGCYLMRGDVGNVYFNYVMPFNVTIVSNSDFQVDKIFNTVEFRVNTDRFNDQMFKTMKVWNDYQTGTTNLSMKNAGPSSLKRKFRIWRAIIPRSKYNFGKGSNMDRIRNPWTYIKLEGDTLYTRATLYDLTVHYSV